MPTFDVDREEITTFEFNGTYLFKQYFDQDELFQQLKEYYDSDNYRFEIDDGDLSEVSQILDNYYFYLKVVEEFRDFCVVQARQGDSSEILGNAVARQQRDGKEIFLMKDKISAKQATEKGASPVEKAGISLEEI